MTESTTHCRRVGPHESDNLRAFLGVDEDHDLWMESHFRRGDDVLVKGNFEVVSGAKFYTASRKIND